MSAPTLTPPSASVRIEPHTSGVQIRFTIVNDVPFEGIPSLLVDPFGFVEDSYATCTFRSARFPSLFGTYLCHTLPSRGTKPRGTRFSLSVSIINNLETPWGDFLRYLPQARTAEVTETLATTIMDRETRSVVLDLTGEVVTKMATLFAEDFGITEPSKPTVLDA